MKRTWLHTISIENQWSEAKLNTDEQNSCDLNRRSPLGKICGTKCSKFHLVEQLFEKRTLDPKDKFVKSFIQIKVRILLIFMLFVNLKLFAQIIQNKSIGFETSIASITFQNEVANSIIYKSTASPMYRFFYTIDKSSWENEFSVNYFNSKLFPSTKFVGSAENKTKIMHLSANYMLYRKINFGNITKLKLKCGLGIKSSFLKNDYYINGDVPRQYVSFIFYDFTSIRAQINVDYLLTAQSEITLKTVTTIGSYIGYPESNPRLVGINSALVLMNSNSSTSVNIQYSYNLSSRWKLFANLSSCFEKRTQPYPVRLFYRGFGLGTNYQF